MIVSFEKLDVGMVFWMFWDVRVRWVIRLVFWGRLLNIGFLVDV